MARISLRPRRTPTLRIAEWYSRRTYGKVLEPALAAGHHPKLLRHTFAFELGIGRWHELDESLKHLALMVSAARIGCSWCLDFGFWKADQLGLPLDKISKVPSWRDHPGSFTERERLVMEYAEAMTDTPPAVTDELAEALVRGLGEPAFVELTMVIAIENQRSRFNSALGLAGQGLSESCAIAPSGLGSEK